MVLATPSNVGSTQGKTMKIKQRKDKTNGKKKTHQDDHPRPVPRPSDPGPSTSALDNPGPSGPVPDRRNRGQSKSGPQVVVPVPRGTGTPSPIPDNQEGPSTPRPSDPVPTPRNTSLPLRTPDKQNRGQVVPRPLDAEPPTREKGPSGPQNGPAGPSGRASANPRPQPENQDQSDHSPVGPDHPLPSVEEEPPIPHNKGKERVDGARPNEPSQRPITTHQAPRPRGRPATSTSQKNVRRRAAYSQNKSRPKPGDDPFQAFKIVIDPHSFLIRTGPDSNHEYTDLSTGIYTGPRTSRPGDLDHTEHPEQPGDRADTDIQDPNGAQKKQSGESSQVHVQLNPSFEVIEDEDQDYRLRSLIREETLSDPILIQDSPSGDSSGGSDNESTNRSNSNPRNRLRLRRTRSPITIPDGNGSDNDSGSSYQDDPDEDEPTGLQDNSSNHGQEEDIPYEPDTNSDRQDPAPNEDAPLEINIAARLARQLVEFQGCEPNAHFHEDGEHLRNELSRHFSLRLFADIHKRFMYPTMGNSEFASVNPSKSFDLMEDIYRGKLNRYIQRRQDGYKVEVCLTCSHQPTEYNAPEADDPSQNRTSKDISVELDVDSILAFPHSLEFAKKGIHVTFTQHNVRNLQSDVHLSMAIPQPFHLNQEERRQGASSIRTTGTTLVPLHTVPYHYFGTVAGFDQMHVYLFFPQMYECLRGNRITRTEFSQLWDRILYPAIRKVLTTGHLQHLPLNADHAESSARAQYVEQGLHNRDPDASRKRPITHHVSAADLGRIWNEIQTRTDGHGLRHFKPKIFIDAKGLKEVYKGYTFGFTFGEFDRHWADVIDMECMNPQQLWIDVGKEVVADRTSRANGSLSRPFTLFWRDCCLTSTWQNELYGNLPPSSYIQTYNTGLLRDAKSITVLTPPSSHAREQGLLYTQAYHSCKEALDQTKLFPFQNPGLEALSMDQSARDLLTTHIRMPRMTQAHLERQYLATKDRAYMCFNGFRRQAYGIREEHRITWELYGNLKHELQQMDRYDTILRIRHNREPFWKISGSQVCDFFTQSVGRYTTGFELARAASKYSGSFIDRAYALAMVAMIRCARFAIASTDISREISLARETFRSSRYKDLIYMGLGWKQSMEKFGYPWLPGHLFDWSRLCIASDHIGRTLFANVVLIKQSHARRALVATIEEGITEDSKLRSLYQSYHRYPRCRSLLHRRMAWQVVWNFREDIWDFVERNATDLDIDNETRDMIRQGTEPLTYQAFEELNRGRPDDRPFVQYITRLRKSDMRTFTAYFNFMFDRGSKGTKQWDRLSARRTFRYLLETVEQYASQAEVEKFRAQCIQIFFAATWVVPKGLTNTVWETNRTGSYIFAAVRNRDLCDRVRTYGRAQRIAWQMIQPTIEDISEGGRGYSVWDWVTHLPEEMGGSPADDPIMVRDLDAFETLLRDQQTAAARVTDPPPLKRRRIDDVVPKAIPSIIRRRR